VSDKRKRAARALMAETGMNYTAALREADRRHAEAQAAEAAPLPAEVPPGAGHFLHNLLNPPSMPGPPYTHTIVPPEPIGWDDDGNPLYPEPGPGMTLTERPLADVVAGAGFRLPAQRIEITADFCQCPACLEGRCETVQPERTGCYWPIEDAPA